MKEVLNQSIRLNEMIRQSNEYRVYLETKKKLYENMDLCNQLREFRRKNNDLQNQPGVNAYDEVRKLVFEHDSLLHNSIVSDFLKAEQRVCKVMQQVYASIADGLEFDYLDEQ